MNLKQSRRKNGRVYLSIEKAYRDKDGKPRAKTIKSLVFFARPISLFVQSGFCSAPDREFYAL